MTQADRRARSGPRLGLVLLLAVMVLGFVSAAVMWVKEDQRVSARRAQVLDQASRSVADSTNRSVTALLGANAMAADGAVSHAEFAAYASDVVRGSMFKMLAREQIVGDADRAGFEASLGSPIVDLDDGRFVTAPARPVYVPVVDVVPVDPSLPSVLGFDIGADPIRAAAMKQAEQSEQVVLSAPVGLAGTQRPGAFVVVPLIARSGASGSQVIGFVSSGLAADDLVEDARLDLPHGATLSLSDGDTALSGPERSAHDPSTPIDVVGRTWTVSVAGAATPNRAWSIAIVAASAAIGVALALWLRRDRQYQRMRDRDLVRSTQLAAVTRRLSFAVERDEVIEVINREFPELVDATYADLGLLVDPDHLTMTNRSAPFDPALLRRYDVIDLTAPLPITRAVRERQTIVVPDIEQELGSGSADLAAAAEAGIRATAACPLYDSAGDTMGVLAFVWARPVEADAELTTTLETLARLCGQTLRRTRLASDAHDLADLASDLAGAVTRAEVAWQIERHIGQRLEASTAVLRVADPALDRLVPIAPSGLGVEFAAPWVDPEKPEEAPSAWAFRNNRPVWLSSRKELIDRFPSMGALVAESPMSAVAAVPLPSSDGSAFGSMAAWWDHDLRFDEETRSFLQTVSYQAAQALERIRLSERETIAARRAQAISELGEQLALAPTREDAIDVLADGARHAAGSAISDVALRDDGKLVVTRDHGAIGSPAEQLFIETIDESLPHGAAVSSGQLVIVANRDDHLRRFPAAEDLIDQDGIQASVCIPMRDGDAEVFGVIGLGWTSPQHFDAADVAHFLTLGSDAARALERSRLRQELHDAQQQVVLALQRQLLAPLEEMAGIELAAHYQPASSAVGMGGDWYDTVSLDDGTLVIVVGDVVGHGVEAVATMAQLQHLVTGLLRGGVPLDRVLPQVDTMITRDTLATAQLLHLDPANGRLGYVNVGHPWALLRHPNGEVTALSASVRPLLGLPGPPTPLTYVELEPGSILLAYTDGLIERRHEPITDAIDRLGQILADVDPDRPLELTLPDLVEAAQGRGDDASDVNDDIAAVLARISSPAGESAPVPPAVDPRR